MQYHVSGHILPDISQSDHVIAGHHINTRGCTKITSFPWPHHRTEPGVAHVKVIPSAPSFSLLLPWATSVTMHTPVLNQCLNWDPCLIPVPLCLRSIYKSSCPPRHPPPPPSPFIFLPTYFSFVPLPLSQVM